MSQTFDVAALAAAYADKSPQEELKLALLLNVVDPTIGGVMVLMLWLYLSGLVIVIGAEMNAEIEHSSPHGKDPGEKVPGQRKSIGPRAAREFRERLAAAPREARRPPGPPVRPRYAGTAMARTGALVGGILSMLFRRRV